MSGGKLVIQPYDFGVVFNELGNSNIGRGAARFISSGGGISGGQVCTGAVEQPHSAKIKAEINSSNAGLARLISFSIRSNAFDRGASYIALPFFRLKLCLDAIEGGLLDLVLFNSLGGQLSDHLFVLGLRLGDFLVDRALVERHLFASLLQLLTLADFQSAPQSERKGRNER